MKKIKYIFDYYRIQIILALLCVLIIGYFVKVIGFDRKKIVLSVLILNDNEEFDIGGLEEELKDYLGITDPKQDITFSFLRTDIEQNQAIILTRLRARAIDLILSDQDTFAAYAQNGFYMELENAVDSAALSEWEEELEQGAIVTLDEQGKILEEGERRDYGLCLAGNRKYIQLGGRAETPVLGIAVNTLHSDYAAKAAEYFWENKE